MELEKFVKTPKTTKFLKTDYGGLYTKSQVVSEVEELTERWLADDTTESEIKDQARRIIGVFEPYDKHLKQKTQKLLKKWGLK